MKYILISLFIVLILLQIWDIYLDKKKSDSFTDLNLQLSNTLLNKRDNTRYDFYGQPTPGPEFNLDVLGI